MSIFFNRHTLVQGTVSFLVGLLWISHAASGGEEPVRIGRQVDNFTLQDFRGAKKSLADYADRKLVVIAFLGTECPLAKLYAPRLSALARQYESRGVTLLGVNSNSQDSITEIAAYARVHEIPFPILKDTGNRLADALSAVRTPEVFVLDAQRRVRYWGRIDDQYGVGYIRDAVQREDLKIALDELLAGQTVSQPVTTPAGCHIGRIQAPKSGSPITYCNQIARILQKNCVECHRAGEIAPFALTEYDEVAGWAETIEEVIRDQRMPPWHANPAHGRFSNARLMSDEEKDMVYRWVADGAPQGDPKDLPEPREYATGWRLPQPPDQIVAMRGRPFVVPAEGTIKYQYFVVDPGFSEDKWVSAAEVIPGDRSVVHHAIVFIRPPRRKDVKGYGWLSAYVPGQNAMTLPPGHARRVPAGSRFVFQMHYTPTGSVKEDVTRVGLVFADPQKVREEVVTLIAINRKFEIPPGAENHAVEAALRQVPHDGRLLAIAPHMHLRGKSFRLVANRQGQSEILLDVPHYDFNWQHAYALAEPLPLTEDMRLQAVSHYDNSENNLVNPDPTAAVRWGDQTWEEMMIAFFEVAIPVNPSAEKAAPPADDKGDNGSAAARALARTLMKRFDRDSDGRVQREEVPEAFRTFAFGRFDKDKDRTISMEEAVKLAEETLRRKKQRSDWESRLQRLN